MAEFTLIASLLILTGCASAKKDADNATGTQLTVAQQLEKDMLRDLISVLPQLLEPLNTTVQFNDAISGDIDSAVLMLVDFGYGLQRVDADQGKNFLTLESIALRSGADKQDKRLRLSIGDIELTRTYRVLSSEKKINQASAVDWRGTRGVVATGPLLVAGTRQELGVDGFQLAPASESATDQLALVGGTVEYTSSAPIIGGIPSISLITEELVHQVATSAFPRADTGQLYADSFTPGNMTHISDGAFASIADNYERVARETVIFPNDSEFLGRPGKLQVKKVLQRFSTNTDLVGIVGCSNGATNLAKGNEGLALGRAQRIAEEFYTAGLKRDKVFNEGCWSPKAGAPGFPDRGVVIDLWRRKV